jgi:hypothetical protein
MMMTMMKNQTKKIAIKGDHKNESKQDCLTICTLKENACSSEDSEMVRKILWILNALLERNKVCK